HSLDKSNGGAYWTQMVLTLDGQLDAAALARSWQCLVQRHAVLRTSFEWKGLRKPLQVVNPAAEVAIQTMDWSDLSPESQMTYLDKYLSRDRAAGFDLKKPPLMRLSLIKTGQQRHKLAWSFHHILLDGWCLPILMNEMLELYEADVAGIKAELKDP